VTARLPDPRFGWPLAERRDGTVLVGRCQVRQQGNIGPVVGGIAAFRPGRPDDHVVLPTESWTLKPGYGGFLGVDSTGAVWANLADIGLSRFLDGTWRVLPGSGVMGADQIDGVIFGGRGDAIIRCRQWCYWNGNEITSYPGLEALVKANRETIAASFGPVLRPRRMAFFGVASDGVGRIWAYDERVPRYSVLVGEDWLDARDVMRAGGLPEARVGGVLAAGGNAVYISDFYQLHRGGRSFFCTFADGKPVFRDAPHTVDSSEVLTTPRDRAGGLWIATNVRTKGGPADAPTDVIGDQLAIRIVGGTVATTLRNAGWPVLCDADGAVWLDQVPGLPHGTFNVWRSGTTTGTVHVPGLTDGLLGGDRPGMVYARTARGVTHLVPDGATYRIGSRYAVAGVDGVFTPLAVVSDGLLVGSGFGKTIGPPPFRGAGTVPQFRLVMARLPRPDTQPAPGKP
jgi:hypothetical protein